jgi:hypothetical protein
MPDRGASGSGTKTGRLRKADLVIEAKASPQHVQANARHRYALLSKMLPTAFWTKTGIDCYRLKQWKKLLKFAKFCMF